MATPLPGWLSSTAADLLQCQLKCAFQRQYTGYRGACLSPLAVVAQVRLVQQAQALTIALRGYTFNSIMHGHSGARRTSCTSNVEDDYF